MASLLELARVGAGGFIGDGPCCAACEKGAGACACADIDEKTKPEGVGADAVVVDAKSSSGPGFFTGLIIGVLVSGAAATLLYVGFSDEGARKASLARRRSVGYAY